MLGRYAADPDLSFSWYDAAVMSKKIREIDAQQTLKGSPHAAAESPRFDWRHKQDLI
jgi:hypothetical protein